MNHFPVRQSGQINADDVFVTLRHANCVDSAPLFCIHPSGRDVDIYRKLARNLRSDTQVVGIRPAHMGNESTRASSLNELAALYSQLIDDRFPQGPIRLLGFSLGGFIATIVADRLRRNGRDVSFLGLIDSDLRWSTNPRLAKSELTLRMQQLSQQLQDVGIMPATSAHKTRQVVSELADMCFGNEVSPSQVVEKLKLLGHTAQKNTESKLFQLIESLSIHCRLLTGFEPPTITGPVHFWWPTEPEVATGVRLAQWEPHILGQAFEERLNGSHYEVMRMPTVRTLARQIDVLLKSESAVSGV